MTGRERPVPRLRVLAVGALCLAVLLLAGAGISALRHVDEVGEVPGIDPAAGDPRLAIDCPEPAPREGLPREEEAEGSFAPLTVTSGDLLDCPHVYDGQPVVYRGEVVGQALGRGARVWLQVNDDVYAGEVGPLPVHRYYLGGNSGIGISVRRAEVEQLTWRGGPAAHGDQVEVRGVFQRLDPASGEIAVITADHLVVLAEGRPLGGQPRTDRAVVAYALLAVAVVLGVLRRRRARA